MIADPHKHASSAAALLFLFGACGADPAPVLDAQPDAAAMDMGADGPRRDEGVRPDAPPPPPPFSGTISGRVVSEGDGVEGAIVRFGGHPDMTLSEADGSFTLVVDSPAVPIHEIGLTAGKVGYWSGGTEVTDPEAPQEIEILPLSIVDDPNYEYKTTDVSEATPNCLHCHREQVSSWRGSSHSTAASNPVLHDLYNGTAMNIATRADCEARGGRWLSGRRHGGIESTLKCYVEGGSVLADLNPDVCGGPGQPTCDDPLAPPANLPEDVAPCADCHAPASEPHVPGTTNLNHVTGMAFYDGIFCDFCHKIRQVTVNDLPGMDGAIELLRPGPPGLTGWANPEIFFSPYTDTIAPVMGNSYQPQFRTSEFCSSCHQWLHAGFRPEDKPLIDLLKWPGGLPLQDTYAEWSQSVWASAGIQCQSCHQPGAPWERAIFDIGTLPPEPDGTAGWPREFGEVRDHTFRGRPEPPEAGYEPAPGDPHVDVLRDPTSLSIEPSRTATTLDVTVRLRNNVAGHSLPTGSPFRSWLLIVRAESTAGPLAATGGHTIPGFVGALESDVLGPGGAALAGDQLTLARPWPATVAPGSVVRFVAPSGTFADYEGTRWFGEPGRTPAEKGMEIVEPLDVATVLSVAGDTVTLDRSMTLPDGTLLHAGDPEPAGDLEVDDELASAALAGAPGWAFAKVMRQSDGTVGVPFFRAMDIVSDNRIPSDAEATTRHTFDVTGVSGDVTVTATLLYRKLPYPLATQRAWPALDRVRKRVSAIVPP